MLGTLGFGGWCDLRFGVVWFALRLDFGIGWLFSLAFGWVLLECITRICEFMALVIVSVVCVVLGNLFV